MRHVAGDVRAMWDSSQDASAAAADGGGVRSQLHGGPSTAAHQTSVRLPALHRFKMLKKSPLHLLVQSTSCGLKCRETTGRYLLI